MLFTIGAPDSPSHRFRTAGSNAGDEIHRGSLQGIGRWLHPLSSPVTRRFPPWSSTDAGHTSPDSRGTRRARSPDNGRQHRPPAVAGVEPGGGIDVRTGGRLALDLVTVARRSPRPPYIVTTATHPLHRKRQQCSWPAAWSASRPARSLPRKSWDRTWTGGSSRAASADQVTRPGPTR